MLHIGSPLFLRVITPSHETADALQLKYPELEEIIERHYQDEYRDIEQLLQRHDADADDALDLELSHEYLIVSALKLQEAKSEEAKKLWSQRYTDISVDVFGRPWIDEAAAIVRQDLSFFNRIQQQLGVNVELVAPIVSAYGSLIEAADADEQAGSTPRHAEVLVRAKDYFCDRYAPAYALLDDVHDDDLIDSGEIQRLFAAMLKRLEPQDDAWKEWTVTEDESSQMSVATGLKQVRVGKNVPPLPVIRVKSLFAHEVLVHAQRAIGGARYDRSLAMGLPGYLTAEEGLGVLAEAAMQGSVPHRVRDRYIDIALALGTSVQPPLGRKQLFVIAFARMVLRSSFDGVPVDIPVLERLAWQHVNRIYRGTLGNEYVGVFTKDVAYYQGFLEMAEYFAKYKGDDFTKAMDFVLSGKFNPLNPAHRQYVHSRRFNVEYVVGTY